MPGMDTTHDTPESPDPPEPVELGDEGRTPSNRRRSRLLAVAGLVIAVPAVGLVSFGVASAQEDPASEDAAIEEVTCDVEMELTPEDVALFNADADALAAFLTERGIPFTVETYEDGVREVVYDYEDDAVVAAVDEFWAERYPEDEAIDPALQADEDALAAYLDERGIAYTWEEDGGYRYVVVAEDDEAGWQAVEEFWAERYPMTAEDVAAANADEDALAAFLDERGISYTRDTDAYGVNFVVTDENDEAAWEAVDEFWAERYGDECVLEEELVAEAADAEVEAGSEAEG
jgi:hypothetical protein